jgi:hypothetical protein
MKTILKLTLFLFAFNILSAQDTLYQIAFTPATQFTMEDRDTAGYLHIDTTLPGNLWQIGTPLKPVFDAAHSLTLALVTDTLNSYTMGNRSSFEMVIYTDDYTQISFHHRMDADSLRDGGVIELSTDGGATWVKPEASAWPDVFHWYGAGDTIASNGGQAGFTGSFGWTESWFGGASLVFTRVRFTFTSDSIDTARDGWMIDDLVVTCLGTGVDAAGAPSPFTFGPNPTTGQLALRSDALVQIREVRLLDAHGKCVSVGNSSELDLSRLPKGVYLLQVECDHGTFTHRVVRQ